MSRQCPKKWNREHVTFDGCRSRRRRTKPRWGVTFLFQPLCIYVCRVRNIEVLTGVLNISFFMNDTIDLHPLHWFHLDVSLFFLARYQ